jgi:hypothetical protein
MSAPLSFLGEKIAVVIRIEVREKIQEELEDLEAIREFDEAKASRDTPIAFDEAARIGKSQVRLRSSHPAAS